MKKPIVIFLSSSFILLVLFSFMSCSERVAPNARLGEVWNMQTEVHDSTDLGYATKYLLTKEDFGYVWKNNSNQIIYRKSRFISKEDIEKELNKESIPLERFNPEKIQDRHIDDFLSHLFGIQNTFYHKSKNTIIFGESQGNNLWRVTWEIEGYENKLLDSISQATTKLNPSLVHLSVKDSLLTIDGWQFEKDRYEQIPITIQPSLFDKGLIEQKDGSVIGLKSNISWAQGISLISDLNKNLGEPTLQLNTLFGFNHYFWTWKDGVIMINLLRPTSIADLNTNAFSRLVLFSGMNESNEFILTP